LPDWFKKESPGLASIMRKITPKRGPALYGFERELKPPSEIFILQGRWGRCTKGC
jgi:hypothetical protein